MGHFAQPVVGRADELVGRRLAGGRGAVVFLAGPPASGRSELLRALRSEVEDVSQTYAGDVVQGEYVPWTPANPNVDKTIAAAAGGLGLAGAAGIPLVGLAGQIISTSQAAAAALGTAVAETSPSTFRTLSRVLRAAAEERPVVCLIDNADEADGRWWSGLLLGFALEIVQELPLFLFMTVEGGDAPGLHTEDEADVAYAARELVRAELAEWWAVPRADPAALREMTGPAKDEVIARLHAMSDGRMGWAAELWGDWKRSQVVERDTPLDTWRFRPGQLELAPTSIAETVRARISEAVGSDLGLAADALRVLGCAALEGRYFTARAVAIALGRPEDEVIDLLDDRLSPSDKNAGGLVREVAPVVLVDADGREQRIWRYEFCSQPFRSAAIRYGLGPQQARQLSDLLGNALQRVYSATVPGVSARISRLYAMAGRSHDAGVARRVADSRVPHNVILDQARAALATRPNELSFIEQRRAARDLLQGVEVLREMGGLDEALEFAKRAALLGRSSRTPEAEVDGLVGVGTIAIYTGEPDYARTSLESALAIASAAGDRARKAHVLTQLGFVDGMTDHYDRAVDWLDQAATLLSQLRDPFGVLSVHLLLANLACQWNRLPIARQALAAIENLGLNYATPQQRAAYEELLGILAFKEGHPNQALVHYQRVAEYQAAWGGEREQASIARGIAIAVAATGATLEARTMLREAVVKAQAMENLSGEVEARAALGDIEATMGAHSEAADELRECVRLYLELRREWDACVTRLKIAELLIALDERSQAEVELREAIKLARSSQHGWAEERANKTLEALARGGDTRNISPDLFPNHSAN
jgi:tetratricopeptide (TPR) repeat protein